MTREPKADFVAGETYLAEVERLSKNFTAHLDSQIAEWRQDRKTAIARYAPFWKRLAGYIIDNVILSLAGLVLVTPLILLGLGSQSNAALVITASIILMRMIYFVAALHLYGQTIGGKIVGIRCTDMRGQNPSWGAALGRESLPMSLSALAGLLVGIAEPFFAFLAILALALNYLAMLWTPQRQCWMDKAAGTLVVRDKPQASWVRA